MIYRRAESRIQTTMNLLKQLVLLTLVLATGCASPRTNLVARTGSTPLPPQIRNVSLMPRPSHSPAERELEKQLSAELQRRGINIVSQAESEFTVAAVIEENWDTHTQTVYPTTVKREEYAGPGTGRYSVSTEPDLLYPQKVEKHIRTEGIRLRLYRTAELKQGRFQTAWEGYIEAGLKLSPERQPALLQILCGYLGRDFIGHVKTGK
jgi:hypothetical protein